MKRVVITGMAGFSPIGNDLESALTQLQKYENSVSLMPEWDMYDGLNTKLGGARLRAAETLHQEAHSLDGASVCSCPPYM